MKKLYQTVLFACVCSAGILSAQASTAYPAGHLIAGFSKQSGNDVVYDLGAISALTDGKSWNLGTLLTTNFTLSTVNWGVIGSTNNPRLAYTSTDGGQPIAIANPTDWGKQNLAIGTLYQNFTPPGLENSFVLVDAGEDFSWNGETISSSLSQAYVNAFENPNVVGLVPVSFWTVPVSGTPTPTLLGTFTLSAGGVITFHAPSAAAPPQPQIVGINRTGNTSTISFTTTNGGFTYTLYYTNLPGMLSSTVSNWPASPTTLIGDGLTDSLTDTTADTNRVYRIGVH